MELQTIKTITELTKKEIQKRAITEVHVMLDEGIEEPAQALIQIKKLKDYVDTLDKELKHSIDLKEGVEMYGAKLSLVNGKKMMQYSDDDEYNRLSDLLKQRKELLDVAFKSTSPIYDADGCEVPKVSVKYSKDSIMIKY